MGEVESVYAEMVSRSDADATGANAALAARDDLFSNYFDLLRDQPHVRQADGYLIPFRFASGAIGVTTATRSSRVESITPR